MNDLQKLTQSIMSSDDYLKQLHRNSGRVVKRGYHFPREEALTTSSMAKYSTPGFSAGTYANARGTKVTTTISTVDTWFEGAFTYYLDLKGTESYDRVKAAATKARHLYGIKVTPDVLWNLMPWSWAIDWGINIGDVMSNVAMFQNDGLVMRYGYVMETRKETKSHRLYGVRLKGMADDLYLEQTYGRETKARLRASPFGFGLSFDGFSNRQLAILAALGISKGNHL